jgi:Na+-driven multidrug efflux pump
VVFSCGMIPLGWLLSLVLGFGADGVFMAITVGFGTLAGVTALIFRRGQWKLQRV